MGLIVRLLYLVWLVGFVALAIVATSQLVFGRRPNAAAQWLGQLVIAAIWPLALFSRAGRDRIRSSFRGGSGE